ncbi:hypothetical protein OHS70_34305 [Streptomyces sp. NBC_00390]|uniref:hypothetical protein n=1 Tax=Streptomyces sp. NBC_00390 TaxID=2975736 RepID=UPI002E1B9F10
MSVLEQPPLFGIGDIPRVRQPATGHAQSIQQRFEDFHALNPWVHRELERMTADCAQHGWNRVGIGMLFELLRYRYGEATRGDEFRLNNNFRSRYVRLLVDEHPEWSPLFEVRALRTD